jgi:hypothetical protein
MLNITVKPIAVNTRLPILADSINARHGVGGYSGLLPDRGHRSDAMQLAHRRIR